MIDREVATRQEVHSVIGRLISAASSPVLAHFIDEVHLTDEEIRQLDEKRRVNRGQS